MKSWITYIDGLARRPILSIVALATLTLFLCVLPSFFADLPIPDGHDERGYWLSAETFAQGRLTNTSHPHWKHFETIHQLQVPSYQSKYPPAQGLIMALGLKLGHPIYGVWLSAVLMVGAIVWMIQAWLPLRWAVVGGLVAVLQFILIGKAFSTGSLGYWSQTYWGGAVAATGGALLFGAARRLIKVPSISSTFALCLGASILALSRPKEGFLVFALVAVLLGVWFFRLRGQNLRDVVGKVIVPAIAFMFCTFVFICVYNKEVTGNALELPWQTHYKQYVVFPLWLWGEPRTDVAWNNKQLQEFYSGWELELYTRHNSLKGFTITSLNKIARFWIFYIGPIFSLTLLTLPWILRSRWMLFIFSSIVLIFFNNLVSFASFPHYSAPITAAIVLMITAGLRHLYYFRWGEIINGQKLILIMFALAAIQLLIAFPKVIHDMNYTGAREELETQLIEKPQKDLLFVRYGPTRGVQNEWVFNASDIDRSEVIWARELSKEQNESLIGYYPDRKVWLVKVGFEESPRLLPYSLEDDDLAI